MTIEELAYFKWVDAGRPCSDGVEFWLQAEAELEVSVAPSRTCDKNNVQPRKVAAKVTTSKRK